MQWEWCCKTPTPGAPPTGNPCTSGYNEVISINENMNTKYEAVNKMYTDMELDSSLGFVCVCVLFPRLFHASIDAVSSRCSVKV